MVRVERADHDRHAARARWTNPGESLLWSRAMSLDTREDFTEADHALFGERLQQSLDVLARLLNQEDFGTGPATLGAELELALVDPAGRPLPVNRAVLAAAWTRVSRSRSTASTWRSTRPAGPARGRAVHGARRAAVGRARRHRPGGRGDHGGRSVAIGILPTLTRDDLKPGMLTDSPRYRALSAGIRRLRREPFHDPHRRRRSARRRVRRRDLRGGEHVPPDPPARPAARLRAPRTTRRRSRRRRSSPPPATRRCSSVAGCGTRPGWRSSGRRWTSASPRPRRTGGRRASRSGTGGCAKARSSCSRRASRCTRRCCRWSDHEDPARLRPRPRCPALERAAAAPRHGVALEPRGIRPERRAGTCASSCARSPPARR